ncbi:hypothetical protein [Rickettsia endosymbiont of Orchestes rusci]|uniref:hypothetical protein n=1 Tax=Rickettsia endosymbiont of Orchestes rusci TaxID=3066250 RepID=UPI00313CCCB7
MGCCVDRLNVFDVIPAKTGRCAWIRNCHKKGVILAKGGNPGFLVMLNLFQHLIQKDIEINLG